jgi:tRNA(fMet)-specific endonuclease VapC
VRVLDTDVCIEILRGNARVIDRRECLADSVATTWITACELFYGAAKSVAPEKNRDIAGQLLASMEILELDFGAAQVFGDVKSKLSKTGHIVADADLIIAAITLAAGASLVTGNLRHYSRIPGLVVEDWIRDDATQK